MNKSHSCSRILFFTYAFICLLVCGCKDNDPKIKQVFIGGTDTGSATYWKNEVINNVTEPSDRATINSIIISGSDIHAVGIVTRTRNEVATYWKNGVEVSLSDGTTRMFATALAILNGDIHVVGYELINNRTTAKYWINGVDTNLADGTIANDIFISGDDVYITGANRQTSKYWKNGISTNLGRGAGTSIFVSENDVYVASVYTSNSLTYARYWKNGEAIELAGSFHTFPSDIVVSGSDVYVCGYEYADGYASGNPRLWKNGEVVALQKKGNYAAANAVAISGTDVYVVGYDTPINDIILSSVYWKNGELHQVGSANAYSYATSIFVSK
jgi:hypothetical protein